MADSAAAVAASGGLAIVSAVVTQIFGIMRRKAQWERDDKLSNAQLGLERQRVWKETTRSLLASADNIIRTLDEMLHSVETRPLMTGSLGMFRETFQDQIEEVRLTGTVAVASAASKMTQAMAGMIRIYDEGEKMPKVTAALFTRFDKAHESYLTARDAFVDAVRQDIVTAPAPVTE